MLHRFDPFAELSRLQDDMARALGREPTARPHVPAVDIYEEQGAFVVAVELPGVRLEDVDVSVDHGVLTLSGERKPASVAGGEWHRAESLRGKFSRTFVLPKSVAADAIEARLDAGILTLRLPKRAEVRPRRVEVKVGAARPDSVGTA